MNGGIAGESSGTIEEVGVENLKISYQYKNNIGGIVGFQRRKVNVYVDGEIGAKKKIGGIAGNISGNPTIANSYALDILDHNILVVWLAIVAP